MTYPWPIIIFMGSHKVSQDSIEIKKILTGIYAKEYKLKVWQKNVSSSSAKICQISNINTDTNKISFKLNDSSYDLDHSQELTFYLSSKDQNFLFNQSNVSRENNLLTLEIPNQLQVSDNRKNNRIIFGVNSHKTITLSISNREITSYQIIDISSGGVAIQVPLDSENIITLSKKIQILKIGSNEMSDNFTAELKYLHKEKASKNHLFLRVGLEFESPISNFLIYEL